MSNRPSSSAMSKPGGLRLLLALGLAVIAAACGSSGNSSSGAQATGTAAGGTTAAQTIEGNDVKRFAALAPPATAPLPPAPTSPTVDRAYLIALFDDAQSVWRREFAAAHLRYQAARAVEFHGVTESHCGRAEDSGPFYCPADHTVYLDLRFLTELLRNKRVGAAAQAFIVGHEVAHHIQLLVGISSRVAAANKADPGGDNARSVQVELQADCLAGVWARSAYPRSGLSKKDLDDALETAHVIGDDYLMQAAGDVVDSSMWQHGSSAQREHWLTTGFQSGRPSACDTFAGV